MNQAGELLLRKAGGCPQLFYFCLYISPPFHNMKHTSYEVYFMLSCFMRFVNALSNPINQLR